MQAIGGRGPCCDMAESGLLAAPEAVAVGSTIGEVVDHWGRTAPAAPAIAARNRKDMSYGELALLTDGIAAQLQHAGFGPDSRIAIVHRGGAEALTTVLGVVKRSIAVPISHEYSAHEFGTHFDACGVEAVIVDARLDSPVREVARARGMRVIDVRRGRDAEQPATSRSTFRLRSDPALASAARADDIAFVFGTSGTTRASKLVPLRHRHMVSRSESTALLHELTKDDRCFNQNRLFLCSGISNSCTALFAGGCVVHPDERGPFDLRAFIDGLTTLRPTWYVASYNFNIGVHQALRRDASAVAGHVLRFIRATSGPLNPEIVTGLEGIFGVPVIEAYSSTESGRICGNPLPPRRRKLGSVGPPTAHSEVSVVDDQGRPVKQGEQGEVVVRGSNVFDGYDRNPTANAEAFFGDWYRTGDVGVFDEDGYLRLVGRIKEMINRGGQKISPVDVDAALLAHPEIADAAAFAVPHPMLGEVVAAAVVLVPDSRLSERDITAFLRDRIEPVKLPRTFVFVERIPRGPSGKVRRSELVKLFETFAPISESARGPRRRDGDPDRSQARAAVEMAAAKGQARSDRRFLPGRRRLAGGDAADPGRERGFRRRTPPRSHFQRCEHDQDDGRHNRPAERLAENGPQSGLAGAYGRRAHRSPVRGGRGERSRGGKKERSTRRCSTCSSLKSRRACVGCGPAPASPPCRPTRKAIEAPRFPSRNRGNDPARLPRRFVRVRLVERRQRDDLAAARARDAARRAGRTSYDYINAAMPGNGIGQLTIQFRESISKFRPDIVALAPGASGSAADRARAKIGYSGIHYSPSRFARRSGMFALEKNLVFALRQFGALSDRGKLKLEPHELRELSRDFEGKLRDLVTVCQKSGALVVLLTRESKIQRGQGRLAQIASSGSRLFYQPYMSISALLDVKDEFNRVYREVAASTGALLVDIVGTLPPTKAYFEDSSHCTPEANRIIGERVGRALGEDPRFQQLLSARRAG